MCRAIVVSTGSKPSWTELNSSARTVPELKIWLSCWRLPCAAAADEPWIRRPCVTPSTTRSIRSPDAPNSSPDNSSFRYRPATAPSGAAERWAMSNTSADTAAYSDSESVAKRTALLTAV